MRKLIVAALAALLFAVPVTAASAQPTAAAKYQYCAYKRGGVVLVLGGNGGYVWRLNFRAMCKGMNSTFHGRRFYGRHGKMRCSFWSEEYRILLAVFTKSRFMGRVTCRFERRAALRAGFIQITP